jgi:hypothetical protein
MDAWLGHREVVDGEAVTSAWCFHWFGEFKSLLTCGVKTHAGLRGNCLGVSVEYWSPCFFLRKKENLPNAHPRTLRSSRETNTTVTDVIVGQPEPALVERHDMDGVRRKAKAAVLWAKTVDQPVPTGARRLMLQC